MFENIINFFKRIRKRETKEIRSKDKAKDRLHLVLMQDRANVSADFLEMMKQEIIEVIKKYIEIDEAAIDVRLTNEVKEDGTTGVPSLYANIPILNIRNEMKRKVSENKSQEEKTIKKTEQKETQPKAEKEETEQKEIQQKDEKEKQEEKEIQQKDKKEEQKATQEVVEKNQTEEEKQEGKKTKEQEQKVKEENKNTQPKPKNKTSQKNKKNQKKNNKK